MWKNKALKHLEENTRTSSPSQFTEGFLKQET